MGMIMGKVYAITSQKGGVGKTTTAINFGAELARHGYKVLLIDADAQGSLTAGLGYREPDRMEITLASVMEKVVNDEKFNKKEYGIVHHGKNLDILPCNIELSGLEVSLANAWCREVVLSKYINRIRDYYDYIIIDCMPSLSLITINVLAAADRVIIPVQAAYLSIKGLLIYSSIELLFFRFINNCSSLFFEFLSIKLKILLLLLSISFLISFKAFILSYIDIINSSCFK